MSDSDVATAQLPLQVRSSRFALNNIVKKYSY
jgi:hypothetical protein